MSDSNHQLSLIQMKKELDFAAELPIHKESNITEKKMFTSISSRSAAAYKRVSIETSVSEASPHQLVSLLMDGLLGSVGSARAAMARGDVATKGTQITRAVRILDEGLKPALNLADGGDLAANLNGLYGYCVLRLTHANLHNDDGALGDVIRVIEPLAQSWKQIGDEVGGRSKPVQ